MRSTSSVSLVGLLLASCVQEDQQPPTVEPQPYVHHVDILSPNMLNDDRRLRRYLAREFYYIVQRSNIPLDSTLLHDFRHHLAEDMDHYESVCKSFAKQYRWWLSQTRDDPTPLIFSSDEEVRNFAQQNHHDNNGNPRVITAYTYTAEEMWVLSVADLTANPELYDSHREFSSTTHYIHDKIASFLVGFK